jgi:antitoxin (DNA-binding transcriptional repressor) of toxin-antitoxin stability system
MRYVSVRELRNESGRVQRGLEEEAVTLTSNGRPVALLIGLEEGEDPAALERLVRQARARYAISRIRRRAGSGGAGVSDEEIAAEIAEVRRSRS